MDLQQELEWTLQRQNFRFAEAVRKRHLPMRQRQIVGACVSLVGLLASGMLLSLHVVTFGVVGVALFVGSFVLSLRLPQFHAWSRRAVGRSITRRAARLMPQLRREPAALPRAALAISTPNLVVLFAREHSQNPIRILQLPEEERAAVIAAASEHEHVTGAVDGYVDPLPVAKIRR